ncbi:MAG: N-acetylmuramoyl-L-alanine amidase [Spirochaetota bacterium]|nr:N-acetylmuramoyl-L-alanine amidase [Spirochaetota bacterium]
MNRRQYISLYEFIEAFDINNSYDVIIGRGKLFYKGSYVVYQVGFSIILVNGVLEKSDYPIIQKNGEILFPIRIISSILGHLYPYLSFKIRGRSYCLYYKKRVSPGGQGKPAKGEIDKDTNKLLKKDKIDFIVIDPGHGGKDPGAIGKGGLKEKWITLKISKHLERYLKRRMKKIKIRLTRGSDKFLELEKRTDIANNLLKLRGNGIFLSIHVNASISQRISGFETYFLSPNPTNEEARATAALENNVIILENKSKRKFYDDVEYIEAIMLTTQIQKESLMLAKCVQQEMDRKIWEFKSKGVKKADFFVLRGTLMPAILVEVGFITNNKEAKLLKNSSYQKRIANGIGDGIISFIRKYNKQLNN